MRERGVKMEILKGYLARTDNGMLINQINLIEQLSVLNHLLGAGLRKPVLDALIQRVQVLQTR